MSTRRSKAADQLLTADRPGSDRCTVVLDDGVAADSPRCPERARQNVTYDNYRTGGETTAPMCGGHEQQVRSGPGWRSSQPLASDGTGNRERMSHAQH